MCAPLFAGPFAEINDANVITHTHSTYAIYAANNGGEFAKFGVSHTEAKVIDL